MSEGPSRAERRSATAARILAAAQEEFGARGVDGATVRGIARRAGVDPSLVLQHYGSKQGLFELAVRPAPDLVAAEVPAHLAEVLDLRLRDLPPATRALMRSVLTSPEAAEVMRGYLQDQIEDLVRASGREDAELRAAVLVSSILGLTIARHFIGISALDDLDGDRITAVIEPWFASLAEGSEEQG